MCEFHDCNCNGLGDTWWTDKCTYFSSIDASKNLLLPLHIFPFLCGVDVSDKFIPANIEKSKT